MANAATAADAVAAATPAAPAPDAAGATRGAVYWAVVHGALTVQGVTDGQLPSIVCQDCRFFVPAVSGRRASDRHCTRKTEV